MQYVWGRKELCTGVFVVKTEVKKQLGIPRRRWMNNIKIDLQEV
jgi:hypothetical protein